MSMKNAAKHCKHKFARIAKLNAMQDEGGFEGIAAGKAKRKMADSWTKRHSNNTHGFFDRKAVREMKRQGRALA